MSFDVDNGLSKVLFRLECIIIERTQLCVTSLGSLLDRGLAISVFPEFEVFAVGKTAILRGNRAE